MESGKNIYLPDELWLHIISFIPPQESWQGLRQTNRQIRACVQGYMITHVLPCFSVSSTYSLGTGPKARWFDVRATAMFAFAHVREENAEHAIYKLFRIRPTGTSERAQDRWRRLCAGQLDWAIEWRVRCALDEVNSSFFETQQTWREIFGIDGPSDYGHVVRVDLRVDDNAEVLHVEWREMIGRYFHRESVRLEEERRARERKFEEARTISYAESRTLVTVRS